MPLIHGKSMASLSKNIATEIRAGKPPKQAEAIAFSEQREAKKMSDGGEVEQSDDETLMDGCAKECMDAMESRDHKAVHSSLQTMMAHLLNKMSSDSEE